jgi:hypothetical protein
MFSLGGIFGCNLRKFRFSFSISNRIFGLKALNIFVSAITLNRIVPLVGAIKPTELILIGVLTLVRFRSLNLLENSYT